jgi:hypothetical protein
MVSKFDSIPGYPEFRREREERLKAVSSEEERSRIRRDEGEKLRSLFETACTAVLQTNLSFSQFASLNELVMQMRGPHAILEDTSVYQQFDLSEKQIKAMTDITNQYESVSSPLCHRYLALQINPVRQNRDAADVTAEMKSILVVFKNVERDEDSELLRVLTRKQKALWDALCGPKINVAWRDEGFADTPFNE